MSFQFVNVTPDNPEHNDETRRRIRSQAMRDYRRRQCVQEESAPSSPEDSTSNISSPQSSSASLSRQESERRKSSTQSLPSKPEGPTRQNSGTSKNELPLVDDLGIAKAKRRSPHSADSPRRRKRVEVPRAQHGTFGTFSITLPKPSKPAQLMLQDIDPLSSPGQLEQMLSHLDALHPAQFGGNKPLFKTRVLALANYRLKNPAKALEDKTIGALACLTSYEISRGSTEAMMHLSGLSQIIKLRGGVDKVGNRDRLNMFLEMLDLVHAVYFHATPMYTSADRSQQSSNEGTQLVQPLDQGMLDEISNYIMSIPEMADLDDYTLDYNVPLEPTTTPPGLDTEVQQWHQFLTQAAQSIAPSYEGSLAYACGLAAELHLATTAAVTPHPSKLQAQVEELFAAMVQLPDDAWDAFHIVHVRILLTALSSARTIPQKSWYNTHLTRQLYRMEAETWSTMKSLMLRFINMQAAARQPRTQAVRVLVNDIEIVVDSSEARDRGMVIQNSLVDSEQTTKSAGAELGLEAFGG